jgi:MoaA/NifB/PqqE/SkfB family radical SAM enzyme
LRTASDGFADTNDAATESSVAGGARPHGADPTLHKDVQLGHLPLVTLYLTERCNSRCVTCDYWRHGRTTLTLPALQEMLPSLAALHTEVALLSGGEPLLNPEWAAMTRLLKDAGLKVWLLTSGLSLEKHARRVRELFDSVTVSLDGTDAATYAAIRGVDAFEKVCAGIRAVADGGPPVSVRVTLQRANYAQLPRFVALARELGAQQVSFLAIDVANPHAFGRTDDFSTDLALRAEDLASLARLLDELEQAHAADFGSGFIAESPAKLRRLLDYFAAVCGRGPYPPVRCNAPQFSAVIAADGHVRPCFFIPGPPGARVQGDVGTALNAPELLELRSAIRRGERSECAHCVCPMWRDLEQVEHLILPPRARLAQ